MAAAATTSSILGGALTAADTIDGGGGADVLRLAGNYAGAHAVVFGANTVTNIERMFLNGGHSYELTTNDATVAAGKMLTVGASALGAGDHLTFDGSAETDGRFNITGGAGDNTVTGGAQDDTFDLSLGGTDTVYGGGGDDYVRMGAFLDSGDRIDGGAETSLQDSVYLAGDYSAGVVFSPTTMTNVEKIWFGSGYSYNLTTDDATVAAGRTLSLRADTLGAADTLTFDGSAETDGSFRFQAGAGNDVLTGGAQDDTFDLTPGGNDAVHAGAGDDSFTLGASLTAADIIDGGAGTHDTVYLDGDYTGANALVFGPSTMIGIETLSIGGGHSYDLTTDDATVAGGQTLTVTTSVFGAGNSLTFDGSAETNGFFAITGGAGDDTVFMGAVMVSNDSFDGGDGTGDTLILDGDYSRGSDLFLGPSTITNVEFLAVTDGNSYSIGEEDGNVGAGQTLTVDGSALTAPNTLGFNGGSEADGVSTLSAAQETIFSTAVRRPIPSPAAAARIS